MPRHRIATTTAIVAAILAALATGAAVFPPLASAWSLNLANAAIVRAAALPSDAPARAAALSDADAELGQARRWVDLYRLPLAQARARLLRGDAPRAVEAFSSARSFASDPISEYVWGDAAWQANQPAVALQHWQTANAYTYFIQQARRAGDAHDWKQAAELGSIAVEIDPRSADAHYVLADAGSRLVPAMPRVMDELDRALELTSDNEFRSTILSRKAEILAGQGNVPDALVLFDQARRVAPLDARPRTGYALALVELRPAAREDALAILYQVIGDSPWYTDAYIVLADWAESYNEMPGPNAEVWLKTGLGRNPNDARLLLPLGELYARQNRLEEARNTLTLALKYETHPDLLREIAGKLADLNAP